MILRNVFQASQRRHSWFPCADGVVLFNDFILRELAGYPRARLVRIFVALPQSDAQPEPCLRIVLAYAFACGVKLAQFRLRPGNSLLGRERVQDGGFGLVAPRSSALLDQPRQPELRLGVALSSRRAIPTDSLRVVFRHTIAFFIQIG